MMKKPEVRQLWGLRGTGQGQGGGFLIAFCLAEVDGVFKVTLAPMVWSFLHQCCEDVGRKGACGDWRRSSRREGRRDKGPGAKGAKGSGLSPTIPCPLLSHLPRASSLKTRFISLPAFYPEGGLRGHPRTGTVDLGQW